MDGAGGGRSNKPWATWSVTNDEQASQALTGKGQAISENKQTNQTKTITKTNKQNSNNNTHTLHQDQANV